MYTVAKTGSAVLFCIQYDRQAQISYNSALVLFLAGLRVLAIVVAGLRLGVCVRRRGWGRTRNRRCRKAAFCLLLLYV